MLLALVLASWPYSAPVPRDCRDRSCVRSRTGGAAIPSPLDVLAPPGGAGMTVECAQTNPTTAGGVAIFMSRTGAAECVTGDGQTVTSVPADTIRQKKSCATCSTIGLLIEDAVANRIGAPSRNLTDAAFVKTNATCAHTAPGMRGNDTNGASRCTATKDGGSVLVTVDHSNFAGTQGSCGDFYVKHNADAGTLKGFFVTYDGGSWRDLTASIGTTWKRVAQAVDMNRDTAILTSGMCMGHNNDAVFGFQFGAPSDTVDIDFMDVQTNDVIDNGVGVPLSLSPVELTDATAKATHHDNIGFYRDGGFNNTQGCVGYGFTLGNVASHYACPQLCTDPDGGFFAYYDAIPNFLLFDGINNPGPVNWGLTSGVLTSTENGWSGGSGGTMFGDNSNGSTLSGSYDGKMLGGGPVVVLGSQFTISGNPCYLDGVMENIKLGPAPNSCHW